jgi:hypothetical protein
MFLDTVDCCGNPHKYNVSCLVFITLEQNCVTIKTNLYIYFVVHFYYNMHQVCSTLKNEKSNNLKQCIFSTINCIYIQVNNRYLK